MSDNALMFENMFSNPDFAKLFQTEGSVAASPALPFKTEALLETQRKNIQALSEAQRIGFESLQTIVQRQRDLFSQILGEQASLSHELLGEGSPEDKFAKHADLFKNFYERTAKGMTELSDTLHAAQKESAHILHKRVSASITEIKLSLEKPRHKKAA